MPRSSATVSVGLAESREVLPGELIPDAVLPASTHFTGKLVMMYGDLYPHNNTSLPPRIRLVLRCTATTLLISLYGDAPALSRVRKSVATQIGRVVSLEANGAVCEGPKDGQVHVRMAGRRMMSQDGAAQGIVLGEHASMVFG